MLIDELKGLKANCREQLYWIGFDVRYGQERQDELLAKRDIGTMFDNLRELLDDSVVYNLVELAPMLKAEWGTKGFRMIADSFNPMPPYPRSVFEGAWNNVRSLTMIETHPVDSLVEVRKYYLKEEALKRTPGVMGEKLGLPEDHPMMEPVILPDARWFNNVSVCIKLSDTLYIFLDSLMGYFCDSKGQMLTTVINSRKFTLGFLNDEAEEERTTKQLIAMASDCLCSTGMALNLMGCKNIGSQEQPVPDKLQKARARRQKEPLTTYRVLTYTVPGQSTGKTNYTRKLIEQAGERRAFHTVPGRTRDYTERGLFGKFKGIFYFQAHTRGTKEAGEVKKDYKVVPSEKAE